MNTDTTLHLHDISHESPHEIAHDASAKALFGFWVYIMSDCLLFASLFATYAVLHTSTFGGPSSRELFNMPFVLVETFILLTSSFTYGLVTLYAHHQNSKQKVLAWLLVTFLLGAAFVTMEVTEFSKLIHEGNGPDKSAFLSAFFTLVGTHGLHVTVGLIWMVSTFVQVWQRGVTSVTLRKLSVLGLFWHFLDIVWIFIFTIVYLMGAL
jgi:cytochrome o ubiquinol oxidase subunit 3